jgi:signal transduction histidine kinase/CheY-like chemotaxis protein
MYRMRTRTVDAHGEKAMLEINKVPILDQAGKVVGTLTMADDVTRESNLEKQLLQSQKMEAIGTLAGGIAHDFNNILTSIINSAEMAAWDVDPESAPGKDLSRVLKAAQRGSELVKQILAFSRPSKVGIQPTDLAEVVNEALGLLKSSLPRNIRISENVDTELPKCPADPTQINQIIMNLCTNSFQAMQEKGGRIEIGLSETVLGGVEAAERNLSPGRYAALSVTDTGPGIPPDIADKIFDPFFTTKGKTEGTGLGLAVVLGIAKAHHGAVTVESRAEEMTSFTVYLPLIPVEEVRVKPGPAQTAEVRARILFVEDDRDQLETVPRLLERLGYRVTSCSDAMSAVDAVSSRSEGFDLVVTDFDMPGTDGIELARILYEMEPDLPVILVSGRERAAGKNGAENIRRTMLKPYNGQDLSEIIRRVMSEEGVSRAEGGA